MAKILTIDIETKPALSYHWRMFKENIGIDQVKEPPGILCFAAKWLGSKEIFQYSDWEHGQKIMLQAAADLIQEADAIVTKNGEAFDYPWFVAMWIKHHIRMPAPTTHIDLDKFLKSKTKFLSRKLDYVLKELGIGEKLDTGGFKLWRQVMDGEPIAQRKMLRYCIRDVRMTERLYMRLRPYIVNHPHMGETGGRECGTCGSNHVHVSKWRRTKTMRIQQLHCQNCGSYFDGIRQRV